MCLLMLFCPGAFSFQRPGFSYFDLFSFSDVERVPECHSKAML
jgi:hypothetical protein